MWTVLFWCPFIIISNSFGITDNFEDAVSYKDRQRYVLPAVYNERRLKEKPIPNVLSDSLHGDDIDGDDAPNGDNSNYPVQIVICDNNDNRANVTSGEEEAEIVGEHIVPSNLCGLSVDLSNNDTVHGTEIDGEKEAGINGELDANSSALDFTESEIECDKVINTDSDPLAIGIVLKREIINDDDEDQSVSELVDCILDVFDEDVVMCYKSKTDFKPFAAECEIKRDDIFSGNLPFAEYPNAEEPTKMDRGYMVEINGTMKEIRIKANYLAKFVEWNTSTNDSIIDGRYISTLMAICIGKKNLRAKNYATNTVDFICGVYMNVYYAISLKL